MQTGQPSRTALGAAGLRAAHQVLDRAAIFSDPLAVRILGPNAEALVQNAETDAFRQRLRWFIAIRARLAEDALAAAIQHGVRQLVVLGAGLDTTAYRRPASDYLRIFEVDHPLTQAWKRQRLLEADIAEPAALRFVPVDFEHETLAGGLAGAGFDPTLQTFFTWLGVVPYLTEPAVLATLGFIGGLPGGAHVVFDYVNPTASIAEQGARAGHQALAARVAALGETLQCHLDSDELAARLRELGFRDIEDLGPRQIAERFFPDRVATSGGATSSGRGSSGGGAHVLRAATT